MPRIIAALAIAAALIFGVFIIKNKTVAPTSSTALIAEQIQNANQSSLAAYAQELESLGAASGTSAILLPPTPDIAIGTDVVLAPPTATDKLAQNILETYINAKQSGVAVSSNVATQIADNVISQPYQDSQTAKTYSAANIKTENSYSMADIENYGNAVGKIISAPPAPNEQFELSVFETFANSGDETVLSSLSLNIARYKKMVSSLLAVPVPQIFVESHIGLLNSLSGIVDSIQKMQNAPTDPVGAINATTEYETTTRNLVSVLSAEKAIFLKENATFSSSQPGYILVK